MTIENEDENLISLSYSRLSDFDRNGPKSLIKRNEVSNIGVKKGSLLDDYIYNSEEFYNKYFISKAEKPKATSLKLANILFERFEYKPSNDEIISIIKEFNLWSNVKKEEIILSYINEEDFSQYIEEYYENKDKKIFIDQTDYFEIKNASSVLKEDKYSKYIFDKNNESYCQVKFEVKYKGFKFIGIIDQIIINRKNKTIEYIDLKTGSGNCASFLKSFLEYRYYIQSAIYSLSKKSVLEFFKLDESYVFLPFKFLYYSFLENKVTSYIVTDDSIFFKDFINVNTGKRRGIDTLLEEIKWHLDNQIFDESKSSYEAKGEYDLLKHLDINEV